jgi:hypothetical protein
MPALHDYIHGPWRAVLVLGVTQILAWGTIFYTPVLIVPLIAAERSWSMAFTMAGFSVCLLVAGLVAPFVGRSIDRFGGHVVMTAGSLMGAVGLALLALVAAPLHAFLLPRSREEIVVPKAIDTAQPVKVLPSKGLPFILVASAFAAYAFVPSGLSAHLLTIFSRSGIDAGTVVWIGALFGPAQVGARLIEFSFGKNLHPLWVVRFAVATLLCAFVMLAVLGMSVPAAAAFALMFGGANGLVTITRGAVPLALFGASGYGLLMGRLAAPFQLMQAAAPLVMAFVVDRASDFAALALACGFAAAALICFVLIRRPAEGRST